MNYLEPTRTEQHQEKHSVPTLQMAVCLVPQVLEPMYPKELNKLAVEEWVRSQQNVWNTCIYLTIRSRSSQQVIHPQASNQEGLHFSIPDREARLSSCGNEPSWEAEWIMGTVDTLFCKIFKETSFIESYVPACILKEWWIATALGSLVVWWNENTNSPAIVGLLDLSDLRVRGELWGRETLNQLIRSVVDNLV